VGRSATADAADFALRVSAALSRLQVNEDARGRLLVAFSGGVDSTVLLHVVKRVRPGARVTAVHFDHGLHADSPAWSRHCRVVAEQLGVDFAERRLALDRAAGASVEALAREARYAALAGLAGPGDVVLTAHHADDQLETVLLRMLRGAGVRGLAAIRADATCGRGRLVRPLLDVTRAEIDAAARQLGLVWLEDPSNQDVRFDRNFLRLECLPRLRERWPAAATTASRLARHMAEAEGLLDELAAGDLAAGDLAAGDLAAGDDPGRIPLALLAPLSPARRNNVLRHALLRLALPLPGAVQLAELGRALEARPDAATLVRWPGVEARVYRRTLYLLPPHAPASEIEGCVDTARACRVAEGELTLVPVEGYGIPDRWARQGLRVALRAGGERFRPRGHRHHKSLRHWFQEQGIVPWMRARVPLIFIDDRLVAIADLDLADELPHGPDDAPFWRPSWTGHSPLR